MEAKEKVVLRDVLYGMKSQFCIPVFQRNYSWNEKNCERLFNDICELINEKDRNHFIGSFVYKMVKLVDTQYIQFVLIDGQQRLTSLTLILKALYDYLGDLGEEYESMREEIRDSYLFNKFAKDDNLKLKLKPNKEDDKNFNLLMENKFDEIDKDSLIYQNYKYFLERIKSLASSVDSFYDALQRLEGVSIILDEDDNAQMIFESLNSTGMDLNDVDLIRNYLLMNCAPKEQEDLYTKYWIKLEQKLGKHFTDFVRDYLSLKNGMVVQNGKNKVYTAFRKYYKNNYANKEITLEEFLEEWLEYADAYSMLLIPTNNVINKRSIENALNDTIMLNMKTTFPFLVKILLDYKKEIIDEQTTIKILRLVESYAVRRSICSVQGGALSQAMASLYKDLKEKYKENLYEDLYTKVAKKMASISTNAYFPRDDQFSDSFENRDMYSSPLKKYILYKLENSNQDKEIINIDNLTIEHVMPNTITNEWKKYLDMEDVDEFHSQYKNKIGNLTLTAYNSEMGQKLFDEKKNNSEFSRLYLNKYFNDIPKWNKNEIEKRGKVLSEMAKKIWPFPNVIPEEDLSAESYNLLDNTDELDFSNTKPLKYIFDDNDEERVNSWSTLYQKMMKFLYNSNSDLFMTFMGKENYCETTRKLISDSEEELINGKKISENLFIETNNNTARKIKILTSLLIDMGYESSSLIVYVVQA